MRALVFLRQKYFREFLSSGAFDPLEEEDTVLFVGEGRGGPGAPLAERTGYLGSIPAPPRPRSNDYAEIRDLLLTSYRSRSRTARIKLAQKPAPERWRAKLAAAPGRRQLRIARLMRRTGLRDEVTEVIRRAAPEVVITPSSGIDASEIDVIRSARALGIPSLALMYNWDNLSSKSAFAAPPDHLAVIGSQSAEHATAIHRIPPERVSVIGSPYIDHHFRHVPGSTESPLSFRYVLFAGCYQPFDELTAIERLDDTIERQGLDVKIVYLPHPRRLPRKRPDFVEEGRFRHVVVEPRVAASYRGQWPGGEQPGPLAAAALPVGAYPALLENAEFVVCPLSTIMLEAAIFTRRVLVIAYHDGLHRTSPGVAVDYLHFEGVDRVGLFEVCRSERALSGLFADMVASGGEGAERPSKEQMDYWIYHDEHPFGERLKRLVHDIGERHGGPPRYDAPAVSGRAGP